MDKADSVRVPVTCECGAKQEVSVAGKDLETLEFTCPGCGKVDRFTPNQISQIVAQVETVRTAAVEYVRKSLDDSVKRVTRRSKYLRQTRKR